MASFTQIGGDYGHPYLYGGFFKNDDNGDWWYWDEPEDGEPITVRQGSAPSDADTMASWIKWPDVLSTMGAQEIPEDLYERVWMIGSYYGWDNLDAYPVKYTEQELREVIG